MPTFAKPKSVEHVVKRKLADGSIKEYRYDRNAKKGRGRPGDATDPNSVKALSAAWQRSPRWRSLSPHTRTNYGIYLRDMEAFEAEPVASVGRRILLTRRDAIAMARGNGAATGFMRTASSMFKFAVEQGWIEHSPCRDIEALPGGSLKAWTIEQADEAERRLITSPLPRGLREPIAEAIRRVIVLARHTGQRRGDLIALRWSAYNGKSIRLTQEKTKVSLVIPVSRVLRGELDAWKATATSVTILTNSVGRPWASQHLSGLMLTTLAKIGLPPDLNVHGLRKMFAADMAQQGASVHEIAAYTGHQTLAMVAVYTKSVDQERLAQAVMDRRENADKKILENVTQLVVKKR